MNDDRFQIIVTRAVLIFLFSVLKSNKSMRNRVWRYARVLDHYANEKVQAEQLVERIKSDGGIEKVSKKVSQGRDIQDEEKDWKLEMLHRMTPEERVQSEQREAEVRQNELAELPPDDYGNPTAWLMLDEEQKEFIRASGRDNTIVILAEKRAIDDEGNTILYVSSIENLDTFGTDGYRAVQDWQKDYDEEFDDRDGLDEIDDDVIDDEDESYDRTASPLPAAEAKKLIIASERSENVRGKARFIFQKTVQMEPNGPREPLKAKISVRKGLPR